MLGGCSLLFGPESVTFRYRMTVEVQTPQGLRSGSAVREVGVRNASMLGTAGFDVVRGEAVAVDLPNGQTLFATLGHGDGLIVLAALRPQGEYGGDQAIRNAKIAITNHEAIDLPRAALNMLSLPNSEELWPLMVHFRDIRDPASVEKVDPDDAAATLGIGYAVRRITVQVTDASVSTGIKQRLIWLPHVHELIKNRDFRPTGIPVGDFQHLLQR
jgi:hypothetical protein